MISQKLLSIAIPSYNSEAYMEHCINTLLTGGARVEILVVNDGSKDNTLAIMEALSEKDRRMHYLSFSRNLGK